MAGQEEPWKIFRNPPPPSDDFDYETTIVVEKKTYYTDFGTPCLYMNEIEEKHFNVPSDAELSLSSTSSEEEEEVLITEVIKKTKNDSRRHAQSSPPQTSRKVKEEPVSSDEDRAKNRRKDKKSRSEQKVVSYSDSESDREEYARSRRTRDEEPRDLKPIKYEMADEDDEDFEEIKHMPGITMAFGEYICGPCNIVMNSLTTLKTHIKGRRHIKQLKSQQIPEVALQALSLANTVPKEKPASRYPPVPPGYKRVSINSRSFIQGIAESYDKGPIPGLERVMEIRRDKEVTYYCKLCDAPCSTQSIMVHLTGFKHLLSSLEMIDFPLYDICRYKKKHEIERRVIRTLYDYEAKYGRGRLEVREDIPTDIRNPVSGPSWRNDEPSTSHSVTSHSDNRSRDKAVNSLMEDLDTSQNDYHCTVCDSHMNNQSMWEAHIRGKRHLKNKKKCPQELSTVPLNKTVFCPNDRAELMNKVKNYGEPIVGLDFIRETHNPAGLVYNCFLCGACASDYDIIDHLINTKHKVKYLETMNRKGTPNGIEDIKQFMDMSVGGKESLINEECIKLIEKLGNGRVQVYKNKNTGW